MCGYEIPSLSQSYLYLCGFLDMTKDQLIAYIKKQAEEDLESLIEFIKRNLPDGELKEDEL